MQGPKLKDTPTVHQAVALLNRLKELDPVTFRNITDPRVAAVIVFRNNMEQQRKTPKVTMPWATQILAAYIRRFNGGKKENKAFVRAVALVAKDECARRSAIGNARAKEDRARKAERKAERKGKAFVPPKKAWALKAVPAYEGLKAYLATDEGKAKWQQLRFEVLRNHHGRCDLCGRGPAHGVTLHVDHIKPKSLHPELAFEPSNLQVLCEDCNLGKSNRDATDFRSQR